MNQNLRVNKTNFHMKGFAQGLALKQRRKTTRKSPIAEQSAECFLLVFYMLLWLHRNNSNLVHRN